MVRHLLEQDDELRSLVEQRVSAHLGRAWQIESLESKADLASHPAATLVGPGYTVFVKVGTGDLAEDRFRQEVAGLRLLSQRAGVRTPTTLDVVQTPEGALLIMEAVEVVAQKPDHWRQMGRTLAQIHVCKGPQFGLETHCYWGDLYQDNRPLADWPEFFWLRRVEPRLRAAVDSGNLPTPLAPRIERLHGRLAQFCGPPVLPSLLHGDAHQNNFILTAQDPVLIDPAVYYGHPEMDLSYVDFFAPVSNELFQGYAEMAPIETGFPERRELWLIPARLAMVQYEVPDHLDRLQAALRTFE